MEITLNGQLVTCTPKEYKELMDMGLIPGQPAGTKAVTQLDEGWKDQIAEIAKRYPKIEPETPKFGTCTVTPVYGCMMPAEAAKKTFYEVHLIDKKQMTYGYLSKYAPDSIKTVPSTFAIRHPLFTDNISEALIFTSRDAASKFVNEWNDYKSHVQDLAIFREIEIPPNAILTYRGLDRVEIEDFNMDMHSISIAEKPTSTETITLQVKAETEGKITVYLMQFNDSEEPTYISRDAYGRLDIGGADIKTSDITEALGFYDRERADDFAADYNSHCTKPTLTVVAKEMPVGTSLNRPVSLAGIPGTAGK